MLAANRTALYLIHKQIHILKVKHNICIAEYCSCRVHQYIVHKENATKNGQDSKKMIMEQGVHSIIWLSPLFLHPDKYKII